MHRLVLLLALTGCVAGTGDEGFAIVNNIAPGPLDNSFYHAAETPQTAAVAAGFSVLGRLGKESDITPVVEFLAGPQSQWITGQVLWVNGGYVTR